MKEQMTRLDVTPFNPFGKARHVVSALFEECLSVDGVESIGEVDLDENGVSVVGFAVKPLASSLQANFRAKRLRNTYLQRPQKG